MSPDGGNPVGAPVRSPREVVEAYNLVFWNEQDLTLAQELLGDTVVRHDVGEIVTLTRDEAVQRVADTCALVASIRFDLTFMVNGDDGEHVALAYQAVIELKDGTDAMAGGIEIFRVVDG
ncbi:polyketide cyclase [Mycobacteroides chelonae]|uniref:polyketide cyclase n=1 Tax=Mycobacteroides chelonae TaxID=1774 RepID=UPI0008AA1670|nr:polyketide cyclase [Mycobacteroides chelonae]OHU32933.1 polyketide cyclase [Mycobacteroides chelonae]